MFEIEIEFKKRDNSFHWLLCLNRNDDLGVFPFFILLSGTYLLICLLALLCLFCFFGWKYSIGIGFRGSVDNFIKVHLND